ncbi:pleckstrin homology domain-containing family A member 8 isoform X2 [Lycorma delicatula]|uniref:pleckstrin homology domain-containing family A member 8 isoform X2 n=1 Tax=Lycorma delicatula TaxID=130591 RepID=UPI003F513493
MSGAELAVEDKKIYGSSIFQSPFPEPIDGKINTCQFLDASRGLVTLLEKFGKVFTAVKCDMNGNIVKLNNKYSTNKEKYVYLNDMILSEKDSSEIIATDALLWLGRGLHLVQRFFELLVEDVENSNTSDELVPLLKTAYKETLKQHHGWVGHQLFALIVRMCPNRSQVIKCILTENDNYEKSIFVTKMVQDPL